VALRPIPWYQRVPPDAPSRTPSCAQNKNSISVLDIPSNTCGPLLVSDSKRVHILFTSVLNSISSNKTPCPDRNSVLDLIPWLVTPVFPRIGGRVVPIKHRMCYAQTTCVTEQRKSMHGCPYRLDNTETQGSGYPPLTAEFYSSHVCPTALVGGVAVVGGGCRGDVD
jgi:hypothetical protein